MPGRRQHAEGSLYQRKSDGRWIAVVHLGWKDGKRQRRVFTGTTPESAVGRREKFLAAKRDGFTMPKGRQPYVSEWMLHWLHNVARREVEATTWNGSYRQKVTELICPYFEKIPLPELNEEDIEEWHARLEARVSARTGRPLSASTIGQCHRIMSRALKAAVARGRLPRNPCSNVSPPAAEREAPDLPSREDLGLILARCEEWPNGARWTVAITTGVRQGEALALEWKRDIHLRPPAHAEVHKSAAQVPGGTDDGPVHAGRKRTNQRITKKPKSKTSRRGVPLGKLAVAALIRHSKAQVRSISNDLVFTDARGEPVHPRADYQDWQDLLADLGLPRYKVHACRHVYATTLLEEGVDPRVVQAMMGWSTAAMAEIYEHVRPVLHQQVADVIDRVFPAAE